ncbi:MAG: hypothetical protein LBT24_05270 [Tannerella sp.]|jgi:hypothetical protein|nr:hypothetical protein [Tannerella sp.]
MKVKEYLAFNLDDFHGNRKGAETTAGMKFVETRGGIENAMNYIREQYPQTYFAVIPKNYFDTHIVYRSEI